MFTVEHVAVRVLRAHGDVANHVMSSLLGEARRVAAVLATAEEPCETHGVEADVYLITLTLE